MQAIRFFFLSLSVFLWGCSNVKNSKRYPAGSANLAASQNGNIDCGRDTARTIELEKKNMEMYCAWENEKGEQVYLYSKHIGPKVEEYYLRTFKPDGSFRDQLFPTEAAQIGAHERNGQYFLLQNDIRTGKRLMTEIKTDSDWVNKIEWKTRPRRGERPRSKAAYS